MLIIIELLIATGHLVLTERTTSRERKLNEKSAGFYDNLLNIKDGHFYNSFLGTVVSTSRKCAARSTVDGWEICAGMGCDPDLVLQGVVRTNNRRDS